jgi:hypothetical protein
MVLISLTAETFGRLEMGPWINQEVAGMAGSGPGAFIGGGWTSGPGNTFDKHRQRRDKFLADHPEWSIVYVRSMDRYEASTGDTDTELVIMSDTHLADLMDRLEARYAPSEASAPEQDHQD